MITAQFEASSPEASARNASSSSGVGGSPVRSRNTRRHSVSRSASLLGESPDRSSRDSTNRSMGFFAHAPSFTAGSAGRTGGTNAQCASYLAPPSIHARSNAFS